MLVCIFKILFPEARLMLKYHEFKPTFEHEEKDVMVVLVLVVVVVAVAVGAS